MACDGNTVESVFILLCIVFCGCLHFVCSRGERQSQLLWIFCCNGAWTNLFAKEKEVKIQKSANGTFFDVIAKITVSHIDNVKIFLKYSTPRKKRSDARHSKTVTNRDMKSIVRLLTFFNQACQFSPLLDLLQEEPNFIQLHYCIVLYIVK